MKKNFTIDATPLLFRGGITNCVRFLIQRIIQTMLPDYELQLLFRLSLFQRKSAFLALDLRDFTKHSHIITTNLPDRLLKLCWQHKIPLNCRFSKQNRNFFLASQEELVPYFRNNKADVIWQVYDLNFLKIPQFFNVDTVQYRSFLLNNARRSSFIIAISQNTKRDVVQELNFPAERIAMIPPFVPQKNDDNIGTFSFHVSARPYVVYIGSLARNKNVDGLMRIFAKCVHNYKLDIDLVLIGKDFCGRDFWVTMAESLGIKDRIHIKHIVSEIEKNFILRHAKMLWQFSWYEGFGIPVLEAAVYGVPVLYSNRGALPEIISNPEQEIDPANEDEASEKAAYALKMESLLQKWQEIGFKRAKYFSDHNNFMPAFWKLLG